MQAGEAGGVGASISTPFLPPSLKALATTFSERPAASAASFLGNVCGLE